MLEDVFFYVLQFWIPAEVEGGGGNASGQGAVSKSSTSILMKMAKLPCFFVCEDSSWANLRPSWCWKFQDVRLEMIGKLNKPNELQMNQHYSFAVIDWKYRHSWYTKGEANTLQIDFFRPVHQTWPLSHQADRAKNRVLTGTTSATQAPNSRCIGVYGKHPLVVNEIHQSSSEIWWNMLLLLLLHLRAGVFNITSLGDHATSSFSPSDRRSGG